MDSFFSPPRESRPFLIRQEISDWARQHYRHNSFYKDEQIPGLQDTSIRSQKSVVGVWHCQTPTEVRSKKAWNLRSR